MLELRLSSAEVSAAAPFLGPRLERWQEAVRTEVSRAPQRAPYAPVASGPALTQGAVMVSAEAVEAAYAGLLSIRTKLLGVMTELDGLAAMRALEPLLRALEDARAAHSLALRGQSLAT